MKKLALRAEHLTELTPKQMRGLAAAGPRDANTVSDGSCVCSIDLHLAALASCDISAGTCVCGCDNHTA